MPPLAKLYGEHRRLLGEFPEIVIRLMGADRQAIERAAGKTWNQIVEPHDDELATVAGILTELRSGGDTPFLFINNHYEGSAPLTIERLRERLKLSV